MSYADITIRRAYSRRWLAQLRAARIAAGECVQCGKASDGRYRCLPCRRVANRQYYTRKAA